MDYDFNVRRETPKKPAEGKLPPAPNKPTFNTKAQPEAVPTSPQAPASAPAGASNVFAKINAETEQRKVVDKAAYNTLSTLKIIGHVLGGLLHHSSNMSEDEIEHQSQRMLEHYATQSKSLHEKLNLADERFVYESITGSISKIISQHYRIAGEKALEVDWSETLAKIIDLDGVWAENRPSDTFGSPEVRRSMMMMNALSPMVSAYQRWNFLHPEPEPVLQRMGDLLWNTVDDALESSEIIQKMSLDEREMLRKNLLFRAGDLLADSWTSLIRETLAELREMSTDERRQVAANGYPLGKIENTYLGQFQMLKQTLSISLSVHTGMKDSQLSDDKSPSGAPGMG